MRSARASPIVDSQIHIWSRISSFTSAADAAAASRHVPLSVSTAIKSMNAAGVAAAVLVPPTFADESNDRALDAARAYPDRFAVMGRFDVSDQRRRGELKSWRDKPGMLGVRLAFFGPRSSQLVDGTAEWFWDAAEQISLPVMLGIPGQVGAMPEIMAAHPRLRLAVDHLGVRDDYTNVELSATVELLARLARFRDFAVKASALPLLSREDYPYKDVARRVRDLVDCFGPMRVFWGSDLTRLRCEYSGALSYLADSQMFSQHELEWIMGKGVCQWLSWSASSRG